MLNYNIKNQRGSVPAWVGIAIIIIAVALIIWLIIANSNSTQPAPATSQTSPSTEQPAKPVFSYVGIIQSINDSEIKLLVPANRNNLNSDRLVTVAYDDKTAITNRTIPKTIPTDITEEQRQNLFKKKNISSSALQVGDDITVVADVDISNLGNFRATRIESRTVVEN